MKKRYLSLLMGSFFLTGCASYNTHFSASSDINPDINGDPSPIAVTVFELSDPISFEAASFSDLYANPQAVLGSTVLAQKSLVLAPGESKALRLPAEKNAMYLGYLAAYRDLNTVTWEMLVPITDTGILGQSFKLNVTASGISIEE